MKIGSVVLSLLSSLAATGAHAAHFRKETIVTPTPMARVATLLGELKTRIETDGKNEQTSYDKYACWCEDTLVRKAGDIGKAKENIEAFNRLIEKLSGEIGTHSADIAQLDKDVAENKESQKEATAVRKKGNLEYEEEKTETEQCIGALEAAIKVLSGAGTGKKFLETMKEAQLLSVVADVRGVFERPTVVSRMSSKDLMLVRQFVARPADFVGDRASVISAAQTGNNPFGDYAPQSTQIQGILKSMYEGFASDLEKGNVEEASAQKAHAELMAVKKQELKTLEDSLAIQTLYHAQKGSKMDETRESLDDTTVKLAADEKLFGEVKSGCQSKASEWAERTRIRTEELSGIKEAISILTADEAKDVFKRSQTTFFQLGSVAHASKASVEASARLAGLAQQVQSTGLATLAARLKSGGHFDKIIASIDQMIAHLRKEAQDDIEHRDRCQGATNQNTNEKQDLDQAVTKAKGAITGLEGEEVKLTKKIADLKSDIEKTEKDIQDAQDMRKKEVGDFRKAVKDDTDAIALLEEAIVALTRAFKANGLPLALVQEDPPSPTYTVDKDVAPETSWQGQYAGRSSESHGIIAILQMLKEDIENEISTARKDDSSGQAQYEEERSAMQETMSSQVGLKISTEKELMNVENQIQDQKEEKASKEEDLTTNGNMKQAVDKDCSWVATHFTTRSDKRQKEIKGLIEAKGYLAGVEATSSSDGEGF